MWTKCCFLKSSTNFHQKSHLQLFHISNSLELHMRKLKRKKRVFFAVKSDLGNFRNGMICTSFQNTILGQIGYNVCQKSKNSNKSTFLLQMEIAFDQ